MDVTVTSSVIKIGKEKVPSPGLGTYQLTGKAGEQAISDAIRRGYRHLDSAQYYRNEEVVGNAVRNSGKVRKDFFVATKIWPTEFSKRNFMPAVERSIRELNLDYIDLLLLHWPADDTANDVASELMNEAIHKGYARLVGVSNFSIAQLKRAQSLAPVFCNQVEYNPYTIQKEMVEYIQANNLMMTAYQPLSRGKVNTDATIISLGKKYGKTPGQIVLRWLVQQENVCPIPKAGSEKHLIENMKIFDFSLSEGDMEMITDLSSKR